MTITHTQTHTLREYIPVIKIIIRVAFNLLILLTEQPIAARGVMLR